MYVHNIYDTSGNNTGDIMAANGDHISSSPKFYNQNKSDISECMWIQH